MAAEFIGAGNQVYPGIYAHKAQRRFSTTCPEGMQQPAVQVRQFGDGMEFFGLRDEVLVPRLGTHILMTTVAQKIVADMGHTGRFTAVDVGTGSGIGAVYLAKALENNHGANVVGTDINQHAIDFANLNFQKNGVRRPAALIRTDLLAGVEDEFGKVDFIFSNPPFAPTQDVPRNGFDPEHAYDGGSDGLNFYRRIAQEAQQILRPTGVLLFQISTCAPIDELTRIAHSNFPEAAVGLIGATEGPLKGKGPIGMLIGSQEVVQQYANRGIR